MLKDDLKQAETIHNNSKLSDLGYWSSLARLEFIKANIKYLEENV